MKLFPVEEQEAVLWRQNWRHRCAGRRIGNERFHRLALVRHEGRDIHEPRHFGIITRLGNYRSAIGMANENDRFALRTDDHLGRGDIAFEGKRRILYDSDRVVVLQEVVNALPAGAVDETAVDENQGRAASIRGSSCLSHLSTFLPLSPRDKTAFRFEDIGYEPCVYGANGSYLYGTVA